MTEWRNLIGTIVHEQLYYLADSTTRQHLVDALMESLATLAEVPEHGKCCECVPDADGMPVSPIIAICIGAKHRRGCHHTEIADGEV